MMFGNRLIIEGDLTLESDLHIGSGHYDEIPQTNRDGETEKSELALVQRDHEEKPLIPATSLKGALRAALVGNDTEDRGTLFGEISEHQKDKGRIGRLWIEPAIWRGGAPVDPNAEHDVLAPSSRTREDSFDRTRVALDRDRAAAAERLLFTEELVRKGGRFAFSATWFIGNDAMLKPEDEQLLIRALVPLAQSLALGRDRRAGQGLIRLDAKGLNVIYRRIDGKTGALRDERDQDLVNRLVKGVENAPKAEAVGKHWRFALEAETPFISIGDPARNSEALDENGEPRKITAPLMRDGKPVLWPSSLLGTLRARAEWLVARAQLRAAKSGGACPRFAADQPGATPKRVQDAANLSSIERLFGVTGWRGELSVEKLAASLNAERHRWTSVAIDRFTAGGLDRLLYTTETFIDGPRFDVVLRHRARVPGLLPDKAAADHALIELLIEDMKTNGVMLGHGAAKGFGWFNYEEVEAA